MKEQSRSRIVQAEMRKQNKNNSVQRCNCDGNNQQKWNPGVMETAKESRENRKLKCTKEKKRGEKKKRGQSELGAIVSRYRGGHTQRASTNGGSKGSRGLEKKERNQRREREGTMGWQHAPEYEILKTNQKLKTTGQDDTQAGRSKLLGSYWEGTAAEEKERSDCSLGQYFVRRIEACVNLKIRESTERNAL